MIEILHDYNNLLVSTPGLALMIGVLMGKLVAGWRFLLQSLELGLANPVSNNGPQTRGEPPLVYLSS